MVIPSLGDEETPPHSPYTSLSSIRTVVPTPCQTWSSLASCHYYEANTFLTLLLDCLLCVISLACHRDYLGLNIQF